MGIYRDHLLPLVVDRVLDGRRFNDLRRRYLDGLAGEVVELGFGSGLNLDHYPAAVTRVHAIEPADGGRRIARPRARRRALPVELHDARGEELPLADASVDHAVSTWTLCTVDDVPRTLSELRRVLRPGGCLRFVEHGLSPEPRVARWQRRLTPVQRVVGGGCHLDRPIAALLAAAGFRFEVLDTFYLRGPRIATWTYAGHAAVDAPPQS